MDRDKDFVDPPRQLREYYRHRETGDLAYIVSVNGEKHIKYDRPHDFTTMPFQPGDWRTEEHAEPLGKTQAVSIAFEADRALCGFLGLTLESRKEWRMLTQKQRSEFVAHGPKGDPTREAMFEAIMGALASITRPE